MNVVITGGGTGGHLYPGLELANFFAERGDNVYYIASANGIDRGIISSEQEKGNFINFPVEYWNLRGFQRSLHPKDVLENFKNVFRLFKISLKSKKILKENNVDLVIGVGGYISYPIVRAASKRGIKTLIHEQNSYPGLVNRKLSSIVDKVGIVYETSRNYFSDGDKIVNVSNPRANVAEQYVGKDFSEELGLDRDKKKILFLGGSLGAEKINDLHAEFVKKLENDGNTEYQTILISGMKNNQNAMASDSDHVVIDYTSELLKYISTADVVVSRGGATTLLEMIYLGRKMIIIPSPNVVANHQLLNAREFADQGLLLYMEEKEAVLDNFVELLSQIENSEEIRYNLESFKKINSFAAFEALIEEL